MADTSFVDKLATTLAEFLTRLKTDAEARKRARRRAGAAAAVAVLHVAFVFLLIYSEWLPRLAREAAIGGSSVVAASAADSRRAKAGAKAPDAE